MTFKFEHCSNSIVIQNQLLLHVGDLKFCETRVNNETKKQTEKQRNKQEV
jgi:hypothetical protein